MRRRAWWAIGSTLAGLTLGLVGRWLPGTKAWNLLAGLLVLAALVLAVSLLPFWKRLAPTPLPGLFERPAPNERWCAHCGHPTPRGGPCRTCGHASASTGKTGALQRK